MVFWKTCWKAHSTFPVTGSSELSGHTEYSAPKANGSHAKPRSIVVKFGSYRTKKEVLRRAWQKCSASMSASTLTMTSPPKVLKRSQYAVNTQKPRKCWKKNKKNRNEINIIFTGNWKKKMAFTKQKYYESGWKSIKQLHKQRTDNTIYKIRDSDSKTVQYKQDEIQRMKKILQVFVHTTTPRG